MSGEINGAFAVPVVGTVCLVLVWLSDLADRHPWVNLVILAIMLTAFGLVGSCMVNMYQDVPSNSYDEPRR